MKFNSAFPLLALPVIVALSGCTAKEQTADPAPIAEAKGAHETNTVVLTKENLTHVVLKTEPVSRGNLNMTLKAVGRVSENLNKTAKVSATLEGRLIQLNVDVNDAVKAGEVIGLVQTPELIGKYLELRSPIDGLIMERRSTLGERVSRETDVCIVTDPRVLWVLAEIKERDIGAVKTGQEASFSVLAYPRESFKGKIVLVGNRVEEESRTLEVRIEADNHDGRLKPGMFTDVEIATTALTDVLTVSDTALQTMGDAQVVFVALGEFKFEKRTVKLGLEEHGRVQILDGLREGEQVVTEGSFILKSELLKGELGEEG